MREKRALKVTGFILSVFLLVISAFGANWKSVTAEASTRHEVRSQEDFEELLVQAFKDSELQIGQKENGTALTESSMGTNAEIVLEVDVEIPDWSDDGEKSAIDALYIPYDVEKLTITGNDHVIKGRISNSYGYGSSSLSEVILEGITVQGERTALTLNVDSACTIDVMGDVQLISAEENGLEIRGEGDVLEHSGSAALVIGEEDKLLVQGDYCGIYDLLDLNIMVDGGKLEVRASQDAALYMNKDEGSGFITLAAQNGGEAVIISGGESGLRADHGFDIQLSDGARAEIEGRYAGIYGALESISHTDLISKITVTDGGSMRATGTDGTYGYGIYMYEGIDLEVDDGGVLVAEGTSAGIYANYNLVSEPRVYKGAPTLFYIQGESSAFHGIAETALKGQKYGKMSETGSDHYAVVGAPFLAWDEKHPEKVYTDTEDVKLHITRLANWDPAEWELSYSYNGEAYQKIDVSEVIRSGGKAEMNIAELLNKPGEYTFRAKQTVEGFESKDSNVVKVQALEPEPIPQTVDVTLHKQDSEDESGLEGAKFELHVKQEDEWKLLEEDLLTDEEGLLEIKNLGQGEYKLTEIEAPEGYELPEEDEIFFDVAPGEDGEMEGPEPIVIPNKALEEIPQTVDILIYKEDIETNDRLEGAEFELYMKQGDEWELLKEKLLTDKQGTLKIADLVEGEYKLIETEAPEGYDATEDEETLFSVEADDDGKLTEPDPIVIYNKEEEAGSGEKPQPIDILIYKQDIDDDSPLQGAEFELYKKQEDEWELLKEELLTDEQGTLELKELEEGEYKLEEMSAPQGYELPEDAETLFEIEMDEEGELEGPEQIIIYNKAKEVEPGKEPQTVDVLIHKQDLEDGSDLEGAEFKLYMRMEERWALLKEKLTTDKQGKLKLEELEEGEYKLTETEAPEGYELPKEKEADTLFAVELDENGDLNGLDPIIIYNKAVEIKPEPEPQTVDVLIHKQDSESKDYLAEAKFELYMKQESEWVLLKEKLTTDKQGILKIEELEEGEYKLTETEAPEGYELPKEADTLFAVEADENGNLEGLDPIIIYNKAAETEPGPEPQTVNVLINKQDIEDASRLAGAGFDLYIKQEEKWVLLKEKLTTDKQGTLKIEKLEEGEYKLTETEVPEGYEDPEEADTLFAIETDEEGELKEPKPITIYNKATENEPDPGAETVDILVYKEDHKIGSRLAGAEFELYVKQEDEWKLLEEKLVTDAQGAVKIAELEEGEYKLTETKTPAGYEMPEEPETLFEVAADENSQLKKPEPIIIYNKLKDSGPDPGTKPEPQTMDILIYKQDSKDDSRLKGAEFELYVKQEEEWKLLNGKLISNDQGTLKIEDLEEGEYKLTEVKAPEGYELPEEAETLFTVETDEEGELKELEPIVIHNKAETSRPGAKPGSGAAKSKAKASGSKSGGSTKTGDNSKVLPYGTAALAALILLVYLTVKKKKKGKILLPVIFLLMLPGTILVMATVSDNQVAVVNDFDEFKEAVESGKAVELKGNITVSEDLGADAPISSNITIYGNGYKLEMGNHQFRLSGKNDLSVSDTRIETNISGSGQRDGVFNIVEGDSGQSGWNASFHNLTFKGAALVGSMANASNFEKVELTGDSDITCYPGAARAVMYARNVHIKDNFIMMEKSGSFVYQPYFQSPAGREFYVADGANVTLTRSNSGSALKNYKSLVSGYAEYRFGEGATVYAAAATNRIGIEDQEQRSAIIHSDDASSFTVEKNADITLEAQLDGYTALLLKKSDQLQMRVEQGATLQINAKGENTTLMGKRGQAPVVLTGNGKSEVLIQGNLNVSSENGNGWYYSHQSDGADAVFTVEDGGRVDIAANNQGNKGTAEYSAFGADGNYNVELTVKSGGKFSVVSEGNRAVSLAGGGSYNKKQIMVTGSSSEFNASGAYWAISAEQQSDLNIEVRAGGKIDLRTTSENNQDIQLSSGNPTSTIYSVGNVNYIVDGNGSELNIYHNGGQYTTIFHDGYGSLQMEITDGGAMDVYNKSSGSIASRASITAQNTILGNSENGILVQGENSYLNVVNEQTKIHSVLSGVYPTGAVSFNHTAKGDVNVESGGNFKTVSSSLSPTIYLNQSCVVLKYPGNYEIRNNSLIYDEENSATIDYRGDNLPDSITSGQAVYNERYNQEYYSRRYGGEGTQSEEIQGYQYTAIEFVECDVKVWSVLKNTVNFSDEYTDNSWKEVSFSSTNGISVIGKWGLGGDTKLPLNEFGLYQYGRIYGKGDGSSSMPDESALPSIYEVRENASEVRGAGVPSAQITVTFPSGKTTSIIVDSHGIWSALVNDETLRAGDFISAYQTESGKTPSAQVSTMILEAH